MVAMIAFADRFEWLAHQHRYERMAGNLLMADPIALTEVPIDNPLSILQPADHLLCQGVGDKADQLIEIAGRGPWCHVAGYMGSAYIGEEMQGCGGQLVQFDTWLKSRGDKIDIFRPVAPGYNATGAVNWFRSNVIGALYDWPTIVRFSLEHLLPLNNPVNHNEDDPAPTRWVCSTAWATADKLGGGVHLVRGLALNEIQPSDVARSWALQYIGTIQGTAA
jgi:hypothetical protein